DIFCPTEDIRRSSMPKGIRALLALSLIVGVGTEALAETKEDEKPSEVQKKYATRAKLGVELSPGVAIPFKKYLDFGGATNSYSMENGVGFGFGLCVTLNNVEFRWAYSALSTGTVTGHIPDEVYTAIQTIEQLTGQKIVQSQNIDKQAHEALILHHLSLGYRLTFEPTKNLQLVFPFGAGVVIATPPDFGLISYNLFGGGIQAGLLTEYTIANMLALGGSVRLSMYVTEPDPNLAGAGFAATEKIFDNAVAWLPMIWAGIHARVYY
ncbi:MAG: hypothetical protein V1754_13820, partial [Pseudomonadota bacterium]